MSITKNPLRCKQEIIGIDVGFYLSTYLSVRVSIQSISIYLHEMFKITKMKVTKMKFTTTTNNKRIVITPAAVFNMEVSHHTLVLQWRHFVEIFRASPCCRHRKSSKLFANAWIELRDSQFDALHGARGLSGKIKY